MTQLREVAIVGVGLHPFGRFPEKSVEEMGSVAMQTALEDAGMMLKDIEIAYVGRALQGMGAGWRVITELGHTGIPIINLEQACASSAAALREAYLSIATGLRETALVVGFEKMQRGLLQTAEETSYEMLMGLAVMPAAYAMLARRYMKEFGATREMFAYVSVKAHRNGSLNPFAQYRVPVSLEEVLTSRMIADPITLLQCSPNSDGASAVVLCSLARASKSAPAKPLVRIVAGAAGNPAYEPKPTEEKALAGGGDLFLTAVDRLAKEAYEQAGIAPEDVRVVQVHDAFTPGEPLVLEALGLVPKGEGARFVWEGRTEISGDLPTNTDGGLLSRGHPIGATGGAMVAELVRQLRGQAGPRQVRGSPTVGLMQNAGIGGINVFIFKR